MKELTVTGRTVEEAIEQALTQLNVTRDHVEVTVIEEPKKGFLGIGSKPAIVKISKTPDPMEEAKAYLQNIIEKMGISVSIEQKQEEDGIVFELISDKVAVLIGKRGQTLNALEYLTNIALNRHSKEYIRIYLDAENYRKKRKETLIQLAERQAERALKLNQKVVLEPMPAKERKVIHLALKEKEGVTTNSKGDGMYRHVVIYPTNENETKLL
ncbi:protein jag [Pueribacillus theae]|uniref:RNA-binding protein KhpB n=1 Tax=Pueribacillus theae TaxID=2171751 RepID=A0A2U1JNE9_9BACI|nr:RNA-binding cell elongation regulator Jag/EloR [Pueribacillus theae]PWA06701.1 protein jag [Pueribacillus theae]